MALSSVRARIRPGAVVNAEIDERVQFIRLTYLHLAGAILAFAGLEYALLQASFTPKLIATMIGQPFSWIVVLGLFMLVSWVADKWAQSVESSALQYLGLGLYIVAEAIIFLPLLFMAEHLTQGPVIKTAAVLTLAMFVGLTGTAFISGRDFSFLRRYLFPVAMIALGTIVAGWVFGFTLGLWFSVAMIAVACCYILYFTSNVLRTYQPGQHVAAALALFSAVALLFWYMVRLVMDLSRD
jgi:FtsH-binding integral membrane protein